MTIEEELQQDMNELARLIGVAQARAEELVEKYYICSAEEEEGVLPGPDEVLDELDDLLMTCKERSE